MPEEASMSFKVYLDLGGGKQEVRRFSLPETVATNYTVLREKICSIFGLSNQDAVLSWKDSDGDSITISTDGELMEAVADSLSNQNVQLVRINVMESSGRPQPGPQPGPSGPQGNQQGDVHLGVTCDACNGRVQGFRYKCVACTDFDLCGACETKGLHKEHKMMRLPKPQDAGGPWFFWKEKEDAPGHFSTHFGMHGNKTGGGTFQTSSSSFSGCDGAGGGAGGAGGAGGCWSSGGPRGRHCFRRGQGGSGKGRGGGWPGWWGRGWGGRNWAGCGQGQTMNSDCGGQQQQQQSSQESQQQQSQQQSNGGCPFPNIFMSTDGGPQQQSSSQQSQQQQPQQQQQNNAGYPFPNMFVSAEGVPYPFTAQGSEMPNTEQVMEDAKQMAEQVAQHAAQQAHHFASHCASEHVANVMRGIWTAWSGQQGQNATHSSSSSSSSSHSTSTSKDGAQQEASAGQEKGKEAGQEKSKEAQQNAAGEEFLRGVGETVANLLDPLGIDVEVAVEHNGIRQRCSLGENGTPASHSSPSPAPSSPARKPESSPPSLASGGSVHMEVQTDSLSGPQTSGKDVETMDVASPAAPEANPRSVDMEGHSGSPEPEDWMLVNQESPSDAAATSDRRPEAPPAETSVSYPSLAELAPHPDPKIQRALDHMSAMGYNNAGGWLTNLLEMKQGDINQVLDLLQPVNK